MIDEARGSEAPPDQGRLKQRYQRLLKIQELLLTSNGGMTALHLRKTLEKLGPPYAVKERRLYEDLKFLGEEIEHGQLINENGCYRMLLPGDQVVLTTQEALFCLRSIGSISSNLLHRGSHRLRENLFQRIGSLYPQLMAKVREPIKQIHFPVAYKLEDDADQGMVFSRLESAIEQKKQINLTFADPSMGFVIGGSPLRLLFYVRAWYLIVYCNPPSGLKKKMKRQLCALRIDNIAEVEVLTGNFRMMPQMNVDDALDRAWGLNFYDPICEAILRFSTPVAAHIERNHRHPTAILKRRQDGTLLYKVMYYEGSKDFLQWVRQYGPNVEILAPEKLRTDLVRDLQISLKHYEQAQVSQ